MKTLKASLVGCVGIAAAQLLVGKTENPIQGVWIDVRARDNNPNPNGGVGLSGYLMSPDPNNPAGTYYHSYDYGWGSGSNWVAFQSAPISAGGALGGPNNLWYPLGAACEPGKAYQINVSTLSGTGDIAVSAPPGYKTVLSGEETGQMSFSGSWLYWVQVLPLKAPGVGRAAEFLASASVTMAVNWELSLGSLHNGKSAGSITLSDAGNRPDWSALFTPALLSYETTSDEVVVYRENGNLRQVIANQVAVDIVTLSSTSYELRCYNPDQIQNSTYPRTFGTSSPFVTYRIEQGATSTTIKFTKEARNVTDLTSTFPVARREFMTIARASTGSTWRDFTWTRTAWTKEGETPVAQTTTTSTDQGGGNRSEQIVVSGDGTSGTTAYRLSRSYAALSGANTEVVSSETIGIVSPQQTTLQYFSSGTFVNDLSSVTLPGGGWIAYDYAPPPPGSAIHGPVQYEYRPYLSAPASVTRDVSQGHVTHYLYTQNEYGAPLWPSLAERFINGTLVEKESYSYAFDVWYSNGHSVTQTTKTVSTGATTSLVSVTGRYRYDWGQSFYRGMPVHITEPDGARKAYAYERGTWNGTSFTPGTGASSRITVITGSSNSAAGAQCQSWGGSALEWTYLIAGKSTAMSTIRDNRALPVRMETQMWDGSQWRLVSSTDYAYDTAGNLVSRTSSNGAMYTAAYDAGLKISETDEQGVTTTYTFDSAGRVSVAVRTGSGGVGTLKTKYTYNAADQITEERIGWELLEQIVTQTQYDDSGRVTSSTPPGLGTTTYAYNVAARTRTATRPDGSTLIETSNLDGTLASITGTGKVNEYHSYGVESAPGTLFGDKWHKVNYGAASSPRWLLTYTDWAGRKIWYEHPGFNGGANYLEEYFYDSVAAPGRLWKSTKTASAPTLYQYNALGELFRSGLDVNGNGTLDLASMDRISETETFLDLYLGAYWRRTDTRTYGTANSASLTTTSTVRTRLTGHTATSTVKRVSETQTTDADGNVTTTTLDINRNARTAVTTETVSGLSGAKVTNFTNGRAVSVTDRDGLATTYGYDALLRQNTDLDSRGNTVSTVFASGTKLPSTVIDDAGHQTVFSYDTSGRVSWQRDQRNHYTRYGYNLRGQVIRQWGDGAMPVEYGYDATYGDRISMSTFRGGSGWDGTTWPSTTGAADTTTWAYDAGSGLVSAKTDALGRSVTQTFCSCGKVSSRTLARGVTVSYAYDAATGEMTSIAYTDGTPSVMYTYTRLGQRASVTDSTGNRTYNYDSTKPWRMTAEGLGTFYGNRVLTRLYESSGVVGRARGYQLGTSGTPNADLEASYGYTATGRFETLSSGRNSNAFTRTFRYAYATNSSLLVALSIDGGHPFTVTRAYEADRDLVTSVDTKWSTATRSRYDFAYDERHNRTSMVQSGDAYGDYGSPTHRIFQYDGRGQLTADVAYLGSDPASQAQPLPGRALRVQLRDGG